MGTKRKAQEDNETDPGMQEDGKRAYRGLMNSWSLKANGGRKGKPSVKQEGRNFEPPAKVSRACRNCRKSKLRCESQNMAKCQRCEEQNLECIYEMKVPTSARSVPDAEWMSTVEDRLDNFGNTLNTIVSLLQQAQTQSNPQPQIGCTASDTANKNPLALGRHGDRVNRGTANFQNDTDIMSKESLAVNPLDDGSLSSDAFDVTTNPGLYDSIADSEEDDLRQLLDNFERLDNQAVMPNLNSVSDTDIVKDFESDFRSNGTLLFEQAQELFRFFHEKISPHLFGYSTSHLDLPNVWLRSPILVAAICAVAAVHHPKLSDLFPLLRQELDSLAQKILFHNITSEAEAVDTIVALCVAGFWLPNSSMLTAMALRLARSVGLNIPKKGSSPLATEERLRLWYLIYILDGHQSLTYNQLPLIESTDHAASISRSLLLQRRNGPDNPAQILGKLFESEKASASRNGVMVDQQNKNSITDGISASTLFSDIRLVSQVEFNQAVKSIFQNSAWELISPSAMGVPWKTNVDLDKWMVAWACLLTPSGSEHDSWSSKSTLIHYNFAKMHINSSKIRELQSSGMSNCEQKTNSWLQGEDGSADAIALSAAQSVIRLSTSDKDILDALQFVPIHIHIMLYYAARLILGSVTAASSPKSARDAFRLIRNLKSALVTCLPRQDNLIGEITTNLNDELKMKTNEVSDILALPSEDQNETPRSRFIAAWPGSIPQHLNAS